MSTKALLDRRSPRYRTALFWSAAAVIPTIIVTPAFASGMRAGSLINNTATATFDNGGTPTTVTSNTVSLKVDEVIDVAVATRDSSDATIGANTIGNVRSFTITNAGNGLEAFKLSALGTVAGNQFNPNVTQIAVDTNGNGTYDAGIDQVIADGAAIAELDADASITAFVISSAGDIADGQRGAVKLTAVSATGTGAPGTLFAGQGTGGGDALIGATTATANANGGFVIAKASVRIDKSATVADPYGGTRVVPGSIVTYRLSALIQGSGSLSGFKIRDVIPTGTAYVAASLVQDGTPLSDAADSDNGTGGASGIDVNLGTVSAGATRVTEFKVKIN